MFGFNYGQQSSDSQSSQGLQGPWLVETLNQLGPTLGYSTSAAKNAAADPAGLSYMPTVNQLLPTDQYGLHPSTTMGTRQLGEDIFSKASSSRAQRGYGTASNLEGVYGDSIRMIAPQLMPLQQAYALQRAQMAPALQQASFGYAMKPIDILQNLISGSGASSSTSSGYGFGVQASGGPTGGTGSDRRLKSNIVRLGTHPLGIGWYEYDIEGRHEQGVMAQELLEVMPEAVTTMPNGYLGVYYDMIGRM